MTEAYLHVVQGRGPSLVNGDDEPVETVEW
jgi:hypothetical protein